MGIDMTETSPTIPPPATLAQRAPRWFGYVVVALIVGYVIVNGLDGFGDAAVYLIVAVFYAAAFLINLPDTLPAGSKLALCSGSGLVGVAIFWALAQIKPEITRYGMLLVALLMAPVARMVAARWMEKSKRS